MCVCVCEGVGFEGPEPVGGVGPDPFRIDVHAEANTCRDSSSHCGGGWGRVPAPHRRDTKSGVVQQWANKLALAAPMPAFEP